MSSKVPAGVTGERNVGKRWDGERLAEGRRGIHAHLNFWNTKRGNMVHRGVTNLNLVITHYLWFPFNYTYSLCINSFDYRSQNLGCSLLFVLSAATLFILLRAWRSADDLINVSRAGTGTVGGVPGGWAPYPRLLASSIPVVSQMLLFMLLPGDLLADLCQSLFLEKRMKNTCKKKDKIIPVEVTDAPTSFSINQRKNKS